MREALSKTARQLPSELFCSVGEIEQRLIIPHEDLPRHAARFGACRLSAAKLHETLASALEGARGDIYKHGNCSILFQERYSGQHALSPQARTRSAPSRLWVLPQSYALLVFIAHADRTHTCTFST